MRALRSAALLALVVGLSAGPSAQGLADAARRASTPPQQTAAKKYTNDDVEAAKPVAPAAPVAAAAPSEAAGTAPAAAEEVKAADSAPTKKPEDNRIAQLKAQLSNKEKQMGDMQARGADGQAALVAKQIAKIQIELKGLEAHLSSPD